MRAVEIPIPPTGNTRVREVGTVFQAEPNKGNARCPKCANWLRAGTRKFRTSPYEKWLAEVGLLIAAAVRASGDKPPFCVWVRIYGGGGTKEYRSVRGKGLVEKNVGVFAENRDLDNVQKTIGDALKESGVVPDDSVRYLKAWRIEYFDRKEHLSALGANRPSNASDLKARCLIKLEPLKSSEETA
jgi:hypothetical protein